MLLCGVRALRSLAPDGLHRRPCDRIGAEPTQAHVRRPPVDGHANPCRLTMLSKKPTCATTVRVGKDTTVAKFVLHSVDPPALASSPRWFVEKKACVNALRVRCWSSIPCAEAQIGRRAEKHKAPHNPKRAGPIKDARFPGGPWGGRLDVVIRARTLAEDAETEQKRGEHQKRRQFKRPCGQ